MIVCPACQHPNPEDAKTCERCGGSLAGFVYRACPRCGALNPPDNTFCNRCLARIQETEPQVDSDEASECISPFTPGAKTIPPQHPVTPPVRPVRDGDRGRIADSIATRHGVRPHQQAETSAPEKPAPSADLVGKMLPRKPVRRPTEPPKRRETERSAFRGVPHSWEELDLLPIEESIARPHRPTYVPPRSPTDQERELSEWLDELIQGPPPLAARRRIQEETREPVGVRTVRLILALLVLAAALLAAGGSSSLTELVAPREALLDLAETWASLGAEDTVLIAFAYSPSYSGELSILADAAVASLAAAEARIVAVALDPAGVALARQTLAKAEQGTAGLVYGEDYVVAGYLSGYQAGARSLCKGWGGLQVDAVHGRPLTEWGVTASLSGAGDVERVILLADDSAAARMWIEQLGCLGVPLDALVTGQLEAALTPYVLSGQIAHLAAGGVAAAELELATGTPAQALRWTDGYVALLAILLLAAVAANVSYVSTKSG
ncbi:MAG: double zinc ribbon domain-containing protein [Anaerolineae bacterium]